MAILEKNNIPTYETLINQELKKHGHEDEEVVARALVKLPVETSMWLLLGGSAAVTAQTCVVAVTDKTLLMVLTKQDVVETPEVAKSSVFPLEKVKLEADKNQRDNSLVLDIDGEETKLHLVDMPEWSSPEELATALSKQ